MYKVAPIPTLRTNVFLLSFYAKIAISLFMSAPSAKYKKSQPVADLFVVVHKTGVFINSV